MGVSITSKKQERQKPVPIIYYNANMKGVDRCDQLMSYYPFEHKSVRWYKKVFVHFIQLLLINSYKLYTFANPRQKQRPMYDFRFELLDQLLPPKLGPSPKRPRQNTDLVHVISKSNIRVQSGNRIRRRRCQMCATKNIRTQTIYFCGQCPDKPALCEVACFDKWHTK